MRQTRGVSAAARAALSTGLILALPTLVIGQEYLLGEPAPAVTSEIMLAGHEMYSGYAPSATGNNSPSWCASGWYTSLGASWSVRETVYEVGEPATFLIWDDGFSLTGAVGYEFDQFRLEFELGFTDNGVVTAGAAVPGVGDFVSSATGNVSLRTYMFNVYHDFDINSRLKPYIGLGLGFYQSEINSLFPTFFNDIGQETGGVNTTSNIPFAYQVRVGASYEVSRRTDFYLGYRYFDGAKLTFAGPPFGVFFPDGAETHSLESGLRFKF